MMSAVAKASAPTAGRSFNSSLMPHQIGTTGAGFQLSFGKAPAAAQSGRRRATRYFTGTWSMCGQTAENSASSSGPPDFFGVALRQLSGIESAAEGL